MKIRVIEPKAEILSITTDALAHLELAGRTCYKSEASITNGSAEKFVRMICRNHHESVLEHASMTARVTCSRACSHQLVRHRIGAYSQESQRYVNYRKKGYEVIAPPYFGVDPGTYPLSPGYEGMEPDFDTGNYHGRAVRFLVGMAEAFHAYEEAMEIGPIKARPEDARYFLPNAAKTEVVVTYNFRTWRHVFRERALNDHAQWEIRGIMRDLLDKVLATEFIPVFGDLL